MHTALTIDTSLLQQYRRLVEFNTAQLWTARPDGGLDYVNPRVAAYAGLPPESLLGDGWGRIVHSLDLMHAADRWRKCLVSGETYSVEMRLQRADAIYRWHLTIAEPVRDEAGAILQWVGTNVDIDDQKRAVEIADAAQLRAQKERERAQKDRERLRRMFHHAPAAMMLYSGPSFVIEQINPSARALLGNREVLGKPVREAFPELEGQGLFEILEQVYTTGEPALASELCLKANANEDGIPEESFWNLTAQPLNEPGEPIGDILSHAIDVTELVRTRRELNQLRAMSHE